MRERLCRKCGKWHPVEAWPAECRVMIVARSGLHAPMVISDTMDPVQSQLDGKHYTSKSKLRRTYREGGVVELGNDAPLTKAPVAGPDEKTLRETVEKSFAAVEKMDNVHETPAMAEVMEQQTLSDR